MSDLDYWLKVLGEDSKDAERRGFITPDGTHYSIGSESPGALKGFYGMKHEVRYEDGKVVVTTNLWIQGRVPEELRDLFPVRATVRELTDA